MNSLFFENKLYMFFDSSRPNVPVYPHYNYWIEALGTDLRPPNYQKNKELTIS